MHDFLPQPYCSKEPGIYAIVNRDNGKIYIGSAARLHRRWTMHRYDLFRGRHNPYLLRAFRKNQHSFYFEVVEELPGADKIKRIEREQFWMDFYKSYLPVNGYNLCPKASSCAGAKHGPEYGARISEMMKGRKWTDAQKAHYRASRTWAATWPAERTITEEVRRKLSAGRKGKKWGEAQREMFKAWHKEHPLHAEKPVIQLSKSGEFIFQFASITEAEKHFGKRSNIHSVCKGNRPYCFGFKWKYV